MPFFDQFKETLTWEDFALYPDTMILKEKLAAFYSLSLDNIYLSHGSDECIKNVFDCFAEGEKVCTTFPCFPMYDVYAAQNNLILEKTDKFAGYDLCVIARPASPIGQTITSDDVRELAKNNRVVLIDEAYINFTAAENITYMIKEFDNLLISRSFSKGLGSAGCRIGYLLGNPALIETVSKFRSMYEVSGPAIRYALFMLDHYHEVEDYCIRTVEERKKVTGLFRDAGLKVIESDSNWIHVEQTEKLLQYLDKNNIKVKTDVMLPDAKYKWLRLSVGPGVYNLLEEFL